MRVNTNPEHLLKGFC